MCGLGRQSVPMVMMAERGLIGSRPDAIMVAPMDDEVSSAKETLAMLQSPNLPLFIPIVLTKPGMLARDSDEAVSGARAHFPNPPMYTKGEHGERGQLTRGCTRDYKIEAEIRAIRNLAAIRALIARHRPGAAVVFTVSPIPLQASFRAIPCLSANAASKAIVRAAVDEYHREAGPTDDRLFYFPSYDIVMHGFDNQWMPDRRHVNKPVLNFNMQVFERYFCTPGIEASEVLASFHAAQAFDRKVARQGHRAPKTKEEKAARHQKRAAMRAKKADRIAVKALAGAV